MVVTAASGAAIKLNRQGIPALSEPDRVEAFWSELVESMARVGETVRGKTAGRRRAELGMRVLELLRAKRHVRQLDARFLGGRFKRGWDRLKKR